MKIKRFIAKDMKTALREVKAVLGNEAVIMSNKKTPEGVEVVAAVDNDTSVEPIRKARPQTVAKAEPQPERVAKQSVVDIPAKSGESFASSLDALLARQSNDSKISQEAFSKPGALSQALKAQTQAIEELQSRQSEQQPKELAQSVPLSESEQHFQDSFRQRQPNTSSRLSQTDVDQLMSAQRDEMLTLKNEMASMRMLLEHQVSGLMWQDLARREPRRALVLERLQSLGLSDQMSDQLACFIPEDVSEEEAMSHGLELLKGQINTTNNEILKRGGVFALVGPTGVGKTTTIAKLAARFAQKHGADKVALISTDTYRIGAYDQLATYAKIIGCSIKVAESVEKLQVVLEGFRNKKLVLIDTAGMGQRDLRLAKHLDTLVNHRHFRIRTYLVASATAQRHVLEDTIEQFKTIPIAGCIFTKLDESRSLGEIISVSLQHSLPIGYLTNGQRVPEDILLATADHLINQALEMQENISRTKHLWYSDNDGQSVGTYG